MTRPCQFCDLYPSTVTVSRPSGKLRLCGRCGYVLQVVLQVHGLEQALPVPPCLLCGKASSVTAETTSPKKKFLGRFRVCTECAGRVSYSITDVLRQCTPWSPGILELPPPRDRVFPPAPGQEETGLN